MNKEDNWRRIYEQLRQYLDESVSLNKFQKLLEQSLAEGFPINYIPEPQRFSLLYYVIRQRPGNAQLTEAKVNLLLDHGAKINFLSKEGKTIHKFQLEELSLNPISFSNDLWQKAVSETKEFNANNFRIQTQIAMDYLIFNYTEYFLLNPQTAEILERILSRITLLLDTGMDLTKSIKDLQDQAKGIFGNYGSYRDKKLRKKAAENLINHINWCLETKKQLEAPNDNLIYWEYEL